MLQKSPDLVPSTYVFYQRLTRNSASNEVKANTAYTCAQECLYIVGNLNILKSSKIRNKGRVEFALESLIALRDRKAFKDFSTDKIPEKVSGVVFGDSEEARLSRLLTKGVHISDREEGTDGEELVDGVHHLAIS